MTAVSSLSAWVTLPSGEVVWCESASLSIDEGWSPSTQATVTIPWTPARAAEMDPRNLPRLRLGLRRSWTGRENLADLTSAWAGLTLADLTSAWAGLTLADLTSAWRTPWDSGTRLPEQLDADLVVRSCRVDLAADTITVQARSDEILAHGARVISSRATESLTNRLLALLALAGISTSGVDFAAGASVTLPPVKVDVTSTVWQYMSDAAAAGSLRLWCDHTRVWRLAAPSALSPTTLTMTRVTGADDTADVDGEYSDVIVWRGTAQGRFTDGTDEWFEPVQTTIWYPSVPSLAPHVVHLWQQDFGTLDVANIPPEFEPTTAELQARLNRLSSRGRELNLTAPADLTARTGQPIVTGAPSLPGLEGVVAAVTFAVPEDTMTIRTRSTVEEA